VGPWGSAPDEGSTSDDPVGQPGGESQA
jgi:hypothetical protein